MERHKLCVTKRDNKRVPIRIDEITDKITELCDMYPKLDISIDPFEVTQNVIPNLYNGIKTSQINEVSSIFCMTKITKHYHYGDLAARLIISDHHKNILMEVGSLNFSNVIEKLYFNKDINECICPLVSEELYNFTMNNKEEVNNLIELNRDFTLDYFGFKTLLKSYLLKINKDSNNEINTKTIESPQHLFLRVSMGIHLNNNDDKDTILKNIKETYDLMSLKYFTHATPTLFNSGTKYQSNVSCFLYSIEDSIDNIFEKLKVTALISKMSGGIGVTISKIRSEGAYIKKFGGRSDGILPLLKVYNETAKYVNQSGKRNGSIAMYCEPWHADIFKFLAAKMPTGEQETKSKELFYALWVPDLFMELIKKGITDRNTKWYLMCPYECPGLTEVYGKEFESLYYKYISEGKYRKEINIMDLWDKILDTQCETGVPYIGYKDAVNHKTNHKNLGTIQNSNLCVSGFTRILTQNGYKTIKSLVNTEVSIWNGNMWSIVTPILTGKQQKMLTVYFSNGSVLYCTEYHKFYLKNGNIVQTKDLKNGDILCSHKLPSDITSEENEKQYYKHIVPINSNIKIKEKWLNSLSPILKEDHKYYIYHHNKHFLIDVMLMLQTMGYYSNIDYIHNVHQTSIKNWVLSYNKDEIEVSITNILDENIIEDTYCFNEPIEHKGMFEGIIAGNCIEIMQYSDNDKFACCILASIVLPTYIENGTFNYTKLEEITKVVVRNLNKIIDINNYPTIETKNSSLSERSLGIGVQGLADVFYKLKIPFESDEAKTVNMKIFETIYYASLCESNRLAKIDGPYETFKGSPYSKGLFQFDLWKERDNNISFIPDEKWEHLRQDIIQYGLRNSLLTALMPTASTSQIMGSVESFEPMTTNFGLRRTSAGEFLLINKYMMQDLIDLNLWNNKIIKQLTINRGSIQNIPNIPDNVKNLYKTCYEIKQKNLIDLSADRGIFIDQSQSLNLFFKEIDVNKLSNAHLYGYSKGLKSGSYYIRSLPIVKQEAFIESDDEEDDNDNNIKQINNEDITTNITITNNEETCDMCSA